MTQRLPSLDGRIPVWNLDDVFARPCPFCGAEGGEPDCIRPDGLTVNECRACGAFFVSPVPTEAQLADFYANYDALHRRDAAADPPTLLAAYRRLGPLNDLRIRELSSMMRIAGKRVLDVGFGRAYFLWCLQSLGADVYGIELDESAITIARGLGITNVRKATIEQCADDRPYDLIVLNDLVEHPLDPMSLLRNCVRLLAPGGLMLVWTPNGAAARGLEAPVTFRVDLEHMQYLTPEACWMMSGVLGLRIVHFETYGFPDIENIDRPRAPIRADGAIRRAVRSVPGLAKTIRKIREWNAPDDRLGSYHLFCIYENPWR
jgi:2-polyprenyl-3-methyl-5-hydroxy-6-metoxy-1,4-benzoquinol methylase